MLLWVHGWVGGVHGVDMVRMHLVQQRLLWVRGSCPYLAIGLSQAPNQERIKVDKWVRANYSHGGHTGIEKVSLNSSDW